VAFDDSNVPPATAQVLNADAAGSLGVARYRQEEPARERRRLDFETVAQRLERDAGAGIFAPEPGQNLSALLGAGLQAADGIEQNGQQQPALGHIGEAGQHAIQPL
jgi:hypothetical protein